MSLRKTVQRLCQNAECTGWVFVYEDEKTGGFSIAGNPKLLADILLTAATLNADLNGAINLISRAKNQLPHSPLGTRAITIPIPSQCKTEHSITAPRP